MFAIRCLTLLYYILMAELVKAVNELLDTFDNTEVDYELEEVELITERWGYGWGYYTITDENKSVVDKGK